MLASRTDICSVYKGGRFNICLKGTGKNVMGIIKILLQESSLKGVGV